MFCFFIILYKYYRSSYSLSLACYTDIHFTPGKGMWTFSSDTSSRNRPQIKQALTHTDLLLQLVIFLFFFFFFLFVFYFKLLGWKSYQQKSVIIFFPSNYFENGEQRASFFSYTKTTKFAMCFWTGVGGDLRLWQYFIITLYSAIAVSKMLMITLLEVSMFPYAKKV